MKAPSASISARLLLPTVLIAGAVLLVARWARPGPDPGPPPVSTERAPEERSLGGARARPAPLASRELRGRVRDAAQHRDLEGARIEVFAVGPDQPARPLAVTRSGPDGTFAAQVPAVADGSFAVRVRAPQRAAVVRTGRWPESTVALLGTLHLDTGRPLTGLVLGPGQVALAQAQVTAVPVVPASAVPDLAPQVLTGPDGRFAFPDIDAAVVDVRVSAPGYARLRSDRVRLAATSDLGTLHLQPASRLGGVVQDAGGRPLRDVLLGVRRTGPTCTCSAETRTDPRGTIRFDDLEDGYYILQAGRGATPLARLQVHTGVPDLEVVLEETGGVRIRLPRLSPAARTARVVLLRPRGPDGFQLLGPARDGIVQGGALEVEDLPPGPCVLEIRVTGAAPARTATLDVRAGSWVSADLTLHEGASLRGRVVDADGDPLQARVALASRHGVPVARQRSAFADRDRRETVTDADGSFEFLGVASGSRWLGLRCEGQADRSLPDLAVPRQGTVDLGDLRLEPGAVLRGSVRKRGQPLADALLQARGPDGPLRETRSDGLGRYRLEGLPPGPLELEVLAPTLLLDSLPLDPSGPAPRSRRQTIPLDPGEVRILDLELSP